MNGIFEYVSELVVVVEVESHGGGRGEGIEVVAHGEKPTDAGRVEGAKEVVVSAEKRFNQRLFEK